MDSYCDFARCYDRLMAPVVDYEKRADYLCALLSHLSHDAGITLDLACGTGSLMLSLKKRGIDVYGVDESPEMLSVAREKAELENTELLLLCQKMQNLDLFGTVDTVFCTLDGINHLANEKEVLKALSRVFLFLAPGGYFIFDANTLYKHETILSDHIFVYDMPEVYCVWKNTPRKNGVVSISLDLFEKEGDRFRRYETSFCERAYSLAKMKELLSAAGFSEVQVFSDLSLLPGSENEERVVFAAKKVR